MNLKHQVWMFMANNRFGLRLIDSYAKLKSLGIATVADDTDIVIEGYPRSANTSAVAAFRIAQNHQVNIAHHVHGAAQIKKACALEIPCIVLIRDPIDSIGSLCVRNSDISLHQATKNYIRFYKGILPLREKVVVAEFDNILKDFDSVIRRVNHHYHTSFRLLGESITASDFVKSEVERMDMQDNKSDSINKRTVALPSNDRHEFKAGYREMLEKSDSLKVLLADCYDLFSLFKQRQNDADHFSDTAMRSPKEEKEE